jgi:site-specific recombinase XerD
VLRDVPQTGRYVFQTTNWRKHFEAALLAAGIDNFRWHDLRHTFATWLGHSGAPLEVIRDQLGHSSISVTQKYRHVIRGEVRAALHNLPTVSPISAGVTRLKVV